MKILIVEDEKPAARRLSKLLLDVDPTLEIIQVLDSVETTKHWLKSNEHPELLFLDIQLGDGTGFDLLKQSGLDCPVIFVTAYDTYALEAFKVNSIDYLLKPVRKDDLEMAIMKYKNLRYKLVKDSEKPGETDKPFKDRFVIKLGNKIKTVLTGDIAYFVSKDKLSFICDQEGKLYPIDLSLDKLENLIDPAEFFRVNRQIIAHANSIQDIQTAIKSRIILTLNPPCQVEAVISSERSALFKKWLRKEF